MSNMKHIKELKITAEKLGCRVDKIVDGNHVKMFLDTPSGPQILTVSRSTSDGRSVLNNLSILRRWARGVA